MAARSEDLEEGRQAIEARAWERAFSFLTCDSSYLPVLPLVLRLPPTVAPPHAAFEVRAGGLRLAREDRLRRGLSALVGLSTHSLSS